MIMAKKSIAAEFEKGQQVVYPLQGVGRVEDIEERPFRGEVVPYYVMYFGVSDMTIRIPVETAKEQGIRAIVSQSDSEKALEIVTSHYEPVPTDWKLRYQMNLDLLRKGEVTDIATVVTKLYHRSKVKELPILERKLYDNALHLLIDEVAFSMGKSKDEVEQLIFMKLESEE
ncbi:CarD-like transcriptional regulator [Olavius algarvensis spirochete endosymbiont]|uniref:CarD family transcriptional regulator n=1 Tax=Olavius algarvensis spirochete endosymbiont TaxID=260710 RepID=UPI000B2CE04D|nr:CarD family transcriptional regulator [Olavius algarvensis spirochete endosymbiont]VDA99718.1 CarD-like transcriptional regulator [Olavius algarvensis spirochete endosymbiont]